MHYELARGSVCSALTGVYGHAWLTIKAIITDLHGTDVAVKAMDRLEFGCCESWLADVEAAVSEVLTEQKAEQEYQS
jgi:hypothetical protein